MKSIRTAIVCVLLCLPLAAIWTLGVAAEESVSEPKVVINVGGNAELAAGESAEAVVAVFGDARSAGDIEEALVAVFGDARADGPVGKGVVSVFGNAEINSSVDGDAVAVLGNLRLGPNARVAGDAVAVGGSLLRDASATVGGQTVSALGALSEVGPSLRSWVEQCLLYLRPLALDSQVAWAWWVAGAVLLLYFLLTLLAHQAVARCAATLATKPGQSLLWSLLVWLLFPALMVLLMVSVIGWPLIPVLWLSVVIAAWFGRIVFLAWLGSAVLGVFGERAAGAHPALSVLIGGVLVSLLYCVPVLGFLLLWAVGFIGLGAVAATCYELLQGWRGQRALRHAAAPALPDAGVSAAPPEPVPMSVEPPPGANYASFGLRLGALLIDLLLVIIVSHVLFGLLPHWLEPSHGQFILLALAAYGAVMWKLKGTTVGGVVCRTRVQRLDGRAIDWSTAIIRALSCFLSLLPLGLGFFWAAFDPQRQAWHDKIAGTVVIRSPEGSSLI